MLKEQKNLAGSEFLIKFVNENSAVNGAYVYLKNGKIIYGGQNEKSLDKLKTKYAIKVGANGLTLKGLRRGKYEIYEIKAPTGYVLEDQPNYDATNKWVKVKDVTVGDQNLSPTITHKNYIYARVRGYVWLENQGNAKAQSTAYNNTYEKGKDSLLKDITVSLVKKEDNGTEKVIKTLKTDSNGKYDFKDNKIQYEELYKYYVRFTYNKQTYMVVPINKSKTVKDVSRVIPETITENDKDDSKIESKGYAITDKSAKAAENITKGLGLYYDSKTGYVENINMGLMKVLTPEYAVNQSIEYIKIVKGNYTYTYKYGNETVVNTADPFSTVSLQNSSRTFTQKIYPSDIKYNVANNLSGDSANAYKVYVVYKIDVTNTTTFNYKYLYQEQGLYLSKLNFTYDKDKYVLEKEYDKSSKSDFALWSNTVNSGEATFNISNSNKVFKTGNAGLKANQTASTYIEFRVTDDSLIKLANGDTNAKADTKAKAEGYHNYKRTDFNWKDNVSKEYTHKSKTLAKEASALSFKLQLSETRAISGTTFEDTKVNTLEGKSRKNERVGNGKFDTTEKTLTDVIVSLMNEDGTVADVYNGELTYNASTGKWSTNKQKATVKVNANGAYTISGVVPGKYYLKFVYGDGKVEYTDINGRTITNVSTKVKGSTKAINSNYYKSTIVTGAAKNTSGANEKTWFINSGTDIYSVATDASIKYYDINGNLINTREANAIKARTTSNDEMNYTSSQEKVVIEAASPVMDIQFEYTGGNSYEVPINNSWSRLKGNCDKMSLGIIERPHIDIKLQKEISNVKLTLSNGTTIINGNPSVRNLSNYLSKVEGGYAKLEIDESYLYGSEVEVTYKVTAINESELDYATEEYYKYGSIPNDEGKLVNTTVTKIVDYDNGNYTAKTSNNIELVNNFENKEQYFDTNADRIKNNAKYKDQLINTSNSFNLKPTAAGKGDNKAEYTIAVSGLLSNSDEDIIWGSYSEILGIKNPTYTAQYGTTFGNYKVDDRTSVSDGGTNETDNGDASMVVATSTGANRSYTIYFIAGGVLALIGLGVLGIKKFVL